MRELIKAEWYKMRRSRLFVVLLIIIAVQAVMQTALVYIVHNDLFAVGRNAEVLAINFSLTGQNGVLMLSFALMILPVCLAAFSGMFTAAEFQNNTIRAVLSLGKKRETVYLSRLFALCVAIGIFIIVSTVVTTLCMTLLFGFGNMPFAQFFTQLFMTLRFQFFLFSTFASVFCMIAFLCRNTGAVIILGVSYFLIMMSLSSFFNSFDTLAFLAKGLPSYYISSANELSGDFGFIAGALVVSLSYIAVSTAVGIFAFRKADVR
jgi:ABC-2 type transport system permease protein